MRSRSIVYSFLALFVLIGLFIWLWPSGKPHKPHTAPSAPALQPLPEYADTGSEVSLAQDGIVNGDEMHRTIWITVSSVIRRIDIVQGYGGTVIDTHSFNNTGDAYTVFLKAINYYGFLSKQPKPTVPADPDGQCPLGFRYIYKLTQDAGDLFTAWTSTCGTAAGNSTGNSSNLLTLFRDQIPDYFQLVKDVNLSAIKP
jgi:hypothetical protein